MTAQYALCGSKPVRFFTFPRKTAVWLALAAAPVLAAGQQFASPGYQQYGYGAPAQPPPGYQQYAQPSYSQPQYQQPQYTPSPYAGQQPYAAPAQSYVQAPMQEPLNPDRLEQLVAPIALYPDTLLAQVLAASTYPAQVAVASQWLQQMQSQGLSSPDQVAAGADAQSWDPSVKALTAFPQVLATMDQNLQWTTELGNAYFNQPQDVMQTVQVMRQRAEQAGTLQSTPQETVAQDQGVIELVPPTPQMVYVPQYDPWTAYGAPVAPYSGFSFLNTLGSFFSNGLMRFGPGIAMSAFQNSPFGWLQWGLDWLGHAIFFNHSTYMTQSASVADWGLPYGGRRAYYGGGGYGRGGYGGGVARRPVPMPERGFERAPAQRSAVQGWAGRNSGFAQSNARLAQPFRYGQSYASSYNRQLQQQAYNRVEPSFPRPQSYNGSESWGRYGYGSNVRQTAVYPARSAYGSSYRAPEPVYQQRGFADQSRSGGFHLFGGGKSSQNFASYKAPKNFGGSYKAPKGFGGGSFKAPKAPKMSSHSGGSGHKRGR